MPQTGFTPIITYNTATASAAPSAANLTQGELAVNVTDKKLYTKDSGGAVVQVGSGPDATETLTNKTLTSPVLSNPSYSGATANGGTVTTIDINGGTIDGTVIGGSSAAAGSFTTLSTSGGNQAVTSYTVSSAYLICTTAFGVDVGPSLGFYGQADGGSATQFGNISARKENATSGNTAGYLSFATRVHGSTPTEKMRISSTGAVTIPGTVSVGGAIVTGGTFAANTTSLLKTAYWGTMVTSATGSTADFVITIPGSATPVMYVPTGTNTSRFAGNVECYGGTFGYGTGAGGTVTQATSKSTDVTLNKPSGQITMHNAALAAGAVNSFYVINSFVSSGDGILITGYNNGVVNPANYTIRASAVFSGQFLVEVKNITGGSLSEALLFNFQVIKGATS